MITYRVRHTGERISGHNAESTLIALRRLSRDPREGLSEFMAAIATRSDRQTGHPVRAEPAEALLEDLVTAGLLEPVQ